MSQKDTLVFDADDTLLATIWTYDVAQALFFEFIYKTFPGRAPSFHDVYERFFEIDAELAKSWGIRRGRWAESMVCLYKEICKYVEDRFGEDLYCDGDARKIRQIGDMPFHYSNHFWLPNVKTVLRILGGRYTLCLLTSYDTNLFPERSKYLGFNEFFGDRIRCIDHKKTAEDFIAVSDWSSSADGKWYAIGNGESDILPALTVGDNWHGIYIPHRNTSPFFNRGGKKASFDAEPITHHRVKNIQRFDQILEHL